MDKLLTTSQIEKKLTSLTVEWSVIGGTELQRHYDCKDFAEALSITNKIGAIAETLNHHPTIELTWGKVVVKITTHSESGLTDKDFELAVRLKDL